MVQREVSNRFMCFWLVVLFQIHACVELRNLVAAQKAQLEAQEARLQRLEARLDRPANGPKAP